MANTTIESPQATAVESSPTVAFSASAAEVEVPRRFRVIDFLLVASWIGLAAFTILFIEQREVVTINAAIAGVILLLLILNRRALSDYQVASRYRENQRRAGLYSNFLNTNESDPAINSIRYRAIQYCQDMTDGYKKTRRNSRNVYYVFQISTIILSGVTPILVLLDKVDVDLPWIKWMPVIFPAIASIVTSLSTSFPFQENWLAANLAVERLEAEQEKFILGVSPAYRLSNLTDDTQRKRKAYDSVESFINQVNQIHLKQVSLAAEPETAPAAKANGAAALEKA